MKNAPKMPPSMDRWPVLMLSTFEVENMMLYAMPAAAYKAPMANPGRITLSISPQTEATREVGRLPEETGWDNDQAPIIGA
jgi:hypothetical protein